MLAVKTKIWHNPSCTSSRKALAYLQERDSDVSVYRYLEERPSRKELEDVLSTLAMRPSELLRPRERVGDELGLYAPGTTEEAILDAMVEHPILVQRPIVISDEGAVVARPADRIDDIL